MERKANQLNDPILKQEIADIKNKYIEAGSDRDTKDQVLADMQALGIKVDTQYSLGDWEREEQRLRGMFDELEKDNQKYGNAQTTQMIEQLRHNVDEVIRSKNVEMARELYDQLWAFDYKIAEVEFFVVWILDWQRQFNQKTWKDRNRARSLINQGLEIIQNQPTTEKLRPIVDGLISLLPDDEKPGNDDILRKRER